MSFADWLRQFRALHEKAKKGALRGADLTAYRAGRDELARGSHELVARAVELAREAGRAPASPAEARRLLGISPRPTLG